MSQAGLIRETSQATRDHAALERPALEFGFRLFDLAVVVITSPLWLSVLAAALAVTWVESGRPLLFVQTRMGRGREPFAIYKIRTMREGVSAPAEGLFSGWTYRNDPRVTRLGRLLRTYRIDELPQFWNVIRGDMGLVGPRPEPWEIAVTLGEQISNYDLRHIVRPGLTGACQVSPLYSDFGTVEKSRAKAALDLEYVLHRSWTKRLMILWRTASVVARGSGTA